MHRAEGGTPESSSGQEETYIPTLETPRFSPRNISIGTKDYIPINLLCIEINVLEMRKKKS